MLTDLRCITFIVFPQQWRIAISRFSGLTRLGGFTAIATFIIRIFGIFPFVEFIQL
jgi:hypothetical protein